MINFDLRDHAAAELKDAPIDEEMKRYVWLLVKAVPDTAVHLAPTDKERLATIFGQLLSGEPIYDLTLQKPEWEPITMEMFLLNLISVKSGTVNKVKSLVLFSSAQSWSDIILISKVIASSLKSELRVKKNVAKQDGSLHIK